MSDNQEVTESEYQRHLEIALNAPGRCTRLQRINSGIALVGNEDGTKRVFRGARTGTADLVGFFIARLMPRALPIYLEIEAKKWNGKQRPAQKARALALNGMGALSLLVRADRYSLEESITRTIAEIDAAILAWERKVSR